MRRPRVVAHRGASHVAPENTIAAVSAAVDFGADAVEIDVQVTRDGVPVVLHDDSLNRTTDVARHYPSRTDAPVSAFTYDEVRRLDAGSWHSLPYEGEPVPTLEQVLDRLRATGVGLLLEIKSPERQPDLVPAVAETVRRFSPGVDVVAQSFHAPSLRAFGRLLPQVPLGLLVRNPPRQPALDAWATAVNPWHGAVSSAYVRRAQLAGLQTYVWTANARSAIRRAADAGVEGIITDRPRRALHLLQRRTSAGVSS